MIILNYDYPTSSPICKLSESIDNKYVDQSTFHINIPELINWNPETRFADLVGIIIKCMQRYTLSENNN